MSLRQNRRRFLATLGLGTATLAGCVDTLDVGGSSQGSNGEDDENGENGNGDDPSEDTSSDITHPAIDHGEPVSDFDEDLDEWFALSGELSADDDEYLTGSRTARIENEGASAGIARSFRDGLDMEGHHLSLAVRVDTPRPARLTVNILAPGQADQLRSTRRILSPYEGWLRMDVGYTAERGEPHLDDVQELRISLDADGGDEADEEIRFWVDDLRMTPAADQGYVMLTFDDNVDNQYTRAFPMFEERDMQGVLAVIPPSLNRPGRLNIDQLREMRDAGWDVSSHAERSDGLAEMDPEDAREAIESDHEYLDNRGFSDGARSHFVPYHSINEEVAEIIREYHDLNSYFGGHTNAVPFTDPIHLSRVDMHDIDGFTNLIDMAAKYNQLAIGLAHGIGTEDDFDARYDDITEDELEYLLDYIEDSDVEMATASYLLDNQDDL
jgi:peptidoglycan/xylan/chitin deacetylase (PgdA/CDA1 family)